MPNNVKLLFFIILLLCGGAPQKVSSQSLHGIKGLPPYERAVLIIKHYEGWHTKKDYPYIGMATRYSPVRTYAIPSRKPKPTACCVATLQNFARCFVSTRQTVSCWPVSPIIVAPPACSEMASALPRAASCANLTKVTATSSPSALLSVATKVVQSPPSAAAGGWNTICCFSNSHTKYITLTTQ